MDRKRGRKQVRMATAWLLLVLVISVYFGDALAPAVSWVVAETRAILQQREEGVGTGSNTVASSSNAVLEVIHKYPDANSEDGYSTETEYIYNLKIGDVVQGLDYGRQQDGWQVERTVPETLHLEKGNNRLAIYYLDPQAMLYDSMLMSTLNPGMGGEIEGTAINPGEAKAVKTAKWTDYGKREAEITLKVKSLPVYEGVDVLLLIDQTGSMKEPFKAGSSETKIAALEDHAHEFVRDLLSDNTGDVLTDNRIGIIGFYGNVKEAYPWLNAYTSTGTWPYDLQFESDSNQAGEAIEQLIKDVASTNNGTTYKDILLYAKDQLQKIQSSRPTYVVLMTDGAPSPGGEGIVEAKALREAGYPLITFGIGLSEAENESGVLMQIAGPGGSNETNKSYCLLSSSTQTLHESLQRVLTKTVGAASNVILTDEINLDHFTIPEGWVPETSLGNKKVTVERTENRLIVKWNIGSLMSNEDTLTIPLMMKDDWKEVPNVYATNNDVKLTYSKYKEDDKITAVTKEEIGDPSLPVHGATIGIRYLLCDERGQLITPEGNDVQANEVENFAHVLLREYVSGDNMIADKPKLLTVNPGTREATYHYTPRQTYTAAGKNYVLYDDGHQFADPLPFTVTDGDSVTFTLYMYETSVNHDPDLITLSVKSVDAFWIYDGKAHQATDYTVTGLKGEDYIESGIELYAQVTNVSQGKVTNAITIDQENLVIKRGDGSGIVVTDQYDIQNITIEKEGEIYILPLSISLQADSKEEGYVAGKVLTATEVTEKNLVKGTALAKGQTLRGKATGKLDRAGEVDNLIDQTSVKIYDADNKEIVKSLGNYAIEYLPGKLKMTESAPTSRTMISITPSGGSWQYDGNEHSQTGFTQTGLMPGHQIAGIVPTVAVKDVADSGQVNRFDETKIRIVDQKGKDVTQEYQIQMASGGTLQVEARPLVLQAASRTETYTFGKVLTAPEVTVADGTSLLPGHVLHAAAVGKLTTVNKNGVANPIDQSSVRIMAGDQNVTHNYAVQYRDGVLIMNAAQSGGSTSGGSSSGGSPGGGATPTQPVPETGAVPETRPEPVDPNDPVTWPDAKGEPVPSTPSVVQPDGSANVQVPNIPPQADIVVRDRDNNIVWQGSADDTGYINVVLPPGDYVLIAIDDENVPLAQMMFTIPDGETPLANLPKTGEQRNSRLWLMALMIGMAAFAYKRVGGSKK